MFRSLILGIATQGIVSSLMAESAKASAISLPDKGTIDSPLAEIMTRYTWKNDLIDIDKARIDETNTREVERFDQNVNDRYASFKRNGYLPQYPIVVERMADGSYDVLAGNSRTLAAQKLKAAEPEVFANAFKATSGKIPAIVFHGLDPVDKTRICVDQGKDQDRLGLNDWEQFLAIKKLAMVGMTETAIARDLGLFIGRGKDKGKPNRSYVQVRVNLARLPDFVQTEMNKSLHGKDGKLKWSDIMPLAKAFNDDNGDELPYPEGGPIFKETWEKIVNPPQAVNPATANQSEAKGELTPAGAVARAKMVGSKFLKAFLLWNTGQLRNRPDVSLATFDAILTKLEASNPEAFQKLLTEPKAQAEPKAEPQAEPQATEAKEPVAAGKANGRKRSRKGR